MFNWQRIKEQVADYDPELSDAQVEYAVSAIFTLDGEAQSVDDIHQDDFTEIMMDAATVDEA